LCRLAHLPTLVMAFFHTCVPSQYTPVNFHFGHRGNARISPWAMSSAADGRSTLPRELDRAAAKQCGGGDENARSFHFCARDRGICVRSRLGRPLKGSRVHASRTPRPRLRVIVAFISLPSPVPVPRFFSPSLGYSLKLDTCKH